MERRRARVSVTLAIIPLVSRVLTVQGSPAFSLSSQATA